MTLENLLDEREAAERLGVSVATIRNWRYLGRDPQPTRILDRLVRYEKSEVDRVFRERRREARSAKRRA